MISRIKGILSETKATFRKGGPKAVWKRFGWKIFAAFFVYYLVRDVTLYLLIPYLIAKHFLD